MTRTITASYQSADQITNTFDELVATGIPQEKIFADREHSQIKVIIPESAVPEIVEILERHQPTNVSEQALRES